MPLGLGGQVQVGVRRPVAAGAVPGARHVPGERGAVDAAAARSRSTADPAKVGKFLPELALFEKSGPFGQVEFYPIPAADPANEPAGLEAGGRYNFQTAALTKTTPAGTRRNWRSATGLNSTSRRSTATRPPAGRRAGPSRGSRRS